MSFPAPLSLPRRGDHPGPVWGKPNIHRISDGDVDYQNVTADAAARIDATQPKSNLYTLPLRVDASPVIDTMLRFSVSGIGQGTVTRALLWLHVTEGCRAGAS